jgi:cobalamin biosynthesis protein CbiD
VKRAVLRSSCSKNRRGVTAGDAAAAAAAAAPAVVQVEALGTAIEKEI